jgi:hypothetical protein
MTRLIRRPQPRHEELTRDMVYQKENLIYIHMYINGSWQVEINGLLYMPGQWFREEFASNMAFDGSYTIRFVRDCAIVQSGLQNPLTPETVYSVQDNPNLKKGKFIHVRLATGDN